MLTPDVIQERLLNACAGRLRPGRRAVAVEGARRLAGGWETEVWSFTARYGPDDGHPPEEDLVLRIYPGAGAAITAAHEYGVMARLGAAGFPVPAVRTLEQGTVPFGAPFIIMEKVRGQVLGQVAAAASPEQVRELAGRYMDLYVRLHRLDWRPLVPGGDDPGDPYARTRLTLEWARQAVAARGQPEAVAPGLDWLERRAAAVASDGLCLNHGDYHTYNVFIRDDGGLCVIDWSAANLADYRYDLAWTLLLHTSYDGPAVGEMLLREYEARSGRPVRDFDYFEAFALARRVFDITASIYAGAGAMGMRPGMEEEFRRNIGYARRLYDWWLEVTGVRLPVADRVLRQG